MIRVDAKPTPDGELRRQILSKCVEKSEREWWAARTIEKLEFELNAANSEIERIRKANLQLHEGAEEQKQRIKQLDDRIERAATAFFRDGSDAQIASQMLAILDEERGKS